jgi:hypothetical protein
MNLVTLFEQNLIPIPLGLILQLLQGAKFRRGLC